jgi:hypothetical protein
MTDRREIAQLRREIGAQAVIAAEEFMTMRAKAVPVKRGLSSR